MARNSVEVHLRKVEALEAARRRSVGARFQEFLEIWCGAAAVAQAQDWASFFQCFCLVGSLAVSRS